MMKTRWLAGVLMLASGLALADGPPSGGLRGLDMDQLEILLDLDAYQKQEVQKVLEAQRATLRAKREQMRSSQTRPTREQMQQEREAAQEAMRAELAKTLSEQQLKKLDVLTERPPMHRGKREGRE